jgi:hypothetical protein
MTLLVRNHLKTRIVPHQIKFGLFISKLHNNSELQKIILLLDNRLNGEFPGFAHAAVQSTQVFIVLNPTVEYQQMLSGTSYGNARRSKARLNTVPSLVNVEAVLRKRKTALLICLYFTPQYTES